MFKEFSSDALLAASTQERSGLCARLAETLSRRFRQSSDWTKTGYEIVEALRQVGHELWSFDDGSPKFQIWGGDYQIPEKPKGELMLEFRAPDNVSVSFAISGHASEADSGGREE